MKGKAINAQPKAPQTHKVERRIGWGGNYQEYCAACLKELKHGDENKRCKGAKR